MLYTAKKTFKVTQGHWHWCHSAGHIRFPITLTASLSCAVLRDIISYCLKSEEVTCLWTHPIWDNLPFTH